MSRFAGLVLRVKPHYGNRGSHNGNAWPNFLYKCSGALGLFKTSALRCFTSRDVYYSLLYWDAFSRANYNQSVHVRTLVQCDQSFVFVV